MTRTVPRSAPTLAPVSFTPEEAAAMAVALAAQPDGPFAAAGRGALEKVLDVLEPDPRRRAQLLSTSLWVSAEAGRSAELRTVAQQAVAQRRVLVLRYRDGQGRTSRREVEPQLLSVGSDHWFLAAWCREREELRWFRGDRIESAELSGESAPRRDPVPVVGPSGRHPAGRALDRRAAPPRRGPGLVVLPGGRA